MTIYFYFFIFFHYKIYFDGLGWVGLGWIWNEQQIIYKYQGFINKAQLQNSFVLRLN